MIGFWQYDFYYAVKARDCNSAVDFYVIDLLLASCILFILQIKMSTEFCLAVFTLTNLALCSVFIVDSGKLGKD